MNRTVTVAGIAIFLVAFIASVSVISSNENTGQDTLAKLSGGDYGGDGDAGGNGGSTPAASSSSSSSSSSSGGSSSSSSSSSSSGGSSSESSFSSCYAVPQLSDLSVILTSMADKVPPQAMVTFTAAVKNAGPADIADATVFLPRQDMTFVDHDSDPFCFNVSGDSPTVRCGVGFLPNGQTKQIRITLQAPSFTCPTNAVKTTYAYVASNSTKVDVHPQDNISNMIVTMVDCGP